MKRMVVDALFFYCMVGWGRGHYGTAPSSNWARNSAPTRFDFWGFGESGDQSVDFSVDKLRDVLVSQFMDRLGIPKAPLVGHSLGGTVSLGTAIS